MTKGSGSCSDPVDLAFSEDERAPFSISRHEAPDVHVHGVVESEQKNSARKRVDASETIDLSCSEVVDLGKREKRERVSPDENFTTLRFSSVKKNGVASSCVQSSNPSSPERKKRCPDSAIMERMVRVSTNEDNCCIVKGILGMIEEWDSGLCDDSTEAIKSNRNGVERRWSSSSTIYFTQKDKWSCGFRNLQMLLSSLLAYTSDDHPYIDVLESCLDHQEDGRRACIPTVGETQSLLETAWAQGFDKDGAAHYQHRIRGKKCWIGAVEVSTVLSLLNMDSTVVQFIKCYESRSLLGKFVWSYFTRLTGSDGCTFCCRWKGRSSLPSCDISTELLQFASSPVGLMTEVESCQCPLLPLYLQWEGHSVTVVGIEKSKSTGKDSPYTFLVFDPMKGSSKLKNELTSWRKKKISQKKVPTGHDNVIANMRLPATNLLQRDCQVVLASFRPLTPAEVGSNRTKINSVTAALQKVASLL